VASGDFSVVVGGNNNTASGIGSVVVGGGTPFSSVTAGGSTASGLVSSVLGGGGNVASGTYATVLGGVQNNATGSSSVACGFQSSTRSISAFAFGTTRISAIGDSQTELFVLRTATTDATPTALCTNSSAAGTTNQVILPNNSAYFFRGEVISGKTAAGDTKGWTIEGVIKRGANAASTALVGVPTVTSTYADLGAATWDIAVTADTTNGGLRVTFTGQAATTIRTVCQIRTTEMTF
jgi:hypothetical protein